jgi:hypothetical protein
MDVRTSEHELRQMCHVAQHPPRDAVNRGSFAAFNAARIVLYRGA